LGTSLIRVLIVDDIEPFREFLRLTLQDKLELQIVGEASDGEEAIELAQALQPDLILLDIGLPKLNGIEAARRIRELAPRSKIIFCSQESSVDIVQAAFSAGAAGYVVKMDAESELLTAVDIVLRGEQFVGSRLAGHDFTGVSDARVSEGDPSISNFASVQQKVEIRCHEAGFYSDERYLLDQLTQFVGDALRAGNAAIVVATESHRNSLLARLQVHGSDIRTAIEQGRYILLDAAEALSTFMVNDLPDPVRFFNLLGDLIAIAAEAAKGGRVAVFGECVDLLSEQGKAETVIRLEHLWNEISKSHDVDILCGYSLGNVPGGMDSQILQRICPEHSAVHSR